LDLRRDPAIQLTSEGASVSTNNPRRDKHLRSADFFDVENHPEITFISHMAALAGEQLQVTGRLEAAGRGMALEVDALLWHEGAALEVEATAEADHRVRNDVESARNRSDAEQADRSRPPRPGHRLTATDEPDDHVLRKHAGKVCVCELVPLFDLSQPTVSHRLKVLREAGIVGSECQGLWAYYFVIPDALQELIGWLS
jgi:hypothetical protein